VKEALRIALQIAEALEYSHEKGVIHRDLKPGNVKITPAGSVKVLDFGLAKLAAEARAGIPAGSPLTMRETQSGVILGTAAYMAPEQARGQPIDKRVDIWAFGVVLYEMLTGHRPFQGNTFTETLAAVLNAEPAWERVPVQHRGCFGHVWRKIPAVAAGHRRCKALPEVGPQATSHNSLWPWVVAGALGVALGVSALMYRAWPTPAGLPMKLNVELGSEVALRSRGGLAISPDGRRLAFRVRGADGKVRLGTRRLDQGEEVTTLAGTEGAIDLFFSPDSQWIAFFADQRLKKIGAEGGAPVALCEAPAEVGETMGTSSPR
jgi:serine/threonine-protein kinase